MRDRPDGEAVHVLHLFPALRESLMTSLQGLEPGDWSRATACAGWSVHDVALHIAGGVLANVSRRRDRHHGNFGEFSPADPPRDEGERLVQTLNAWNEAWVLAARRISPALTIDIIDFAGAELEAYFRTLDFDAMSDPVGWAGPNPAPVWLDVAREYTEVWTHAAQIREATGRAIVDDPALFAPVMEAFAHGLPHALRDVDRPEDIALRVVLTGDGGGEWWARREPSGWQLARGVGREADATVEIDAVTAWRMATKGIPQGEAHARARVEGDAGLAEGFFNLVAILA
jgi:uncharacterized protein (TIGR03083 family)